MCGLLWERSRVFGVAILTVSCALLLHGTASAGAAELGSDGDETSQPAGSKREARALRRAVKLLELEPGIRVVLIEPELAPDPASIRRLDAFVVREPDGSLRNIVYVNRQSEIVRQASDGSTLHVGVLAAVIYHETQHLAGASEEEARRAEIAFFRSLMASGHVPSAAGHRYLQLLAQHADAAPNVPSY